MISVELGGVKRRDRRIRPENQFFAPPMSRGVACDLRAANDGRRHYHAFGPISA